MAYSSIPIGSSVSLVAHLYAFTAQREVVVIHSCVIRERLGDFLPNDFLCVNASIAAFRRNLRNKTPLPALGNWHGSIVRSEAIIAVTFLLIRMKFRCFTQELHDYDVQEEVYSLMMFCIICLILKQKQ